MALTKYLYSIFEYPLNTQTTLFLYVVVKKKEKEKSLE